MTVGTGMGWKRRYRADVRDVHTRSEWSDRNTDSAFVRADRLMTVGDSFFFLRGSRCHLPLCSELCMYMLI